MKKISYENNKIKVLPESYTPGEWHVGMNPGPIVYGPLGEQVADCRWLLGGDEVRANAHLIAAAPELLEALYQALPYVEDQLQDLGYKPGAVERRVKFIKDAIRKAEKGA